MNNVYVSPEARLLCLSTKDVIQTSIIHMEEVEFFSMRNVGDESNFEPLNP